MNKINTSNLVKKFYMTKRIRHNNKISIIRLFDLNNLYDDIWKKLILKQYLHPIYAIKLGYVCKRFRTDLKDMEKLIIAFTRRCNKCGDGTVLTHSCNLSDKQPCLQKQTYKFSKENWLSIYKYEIKSIWFPVYMEINVITLL